MTYPEFKAQLMGDETMRRWLRKLIVEEMRGASGVFRQEPVPAGVITYAAAAELLGVREQTIRKLVCNSYLEGMLIGGHGHVMRTEVITHGLRGRLSMRQHVMAVLQKEKEPAAVNEHEAVSKLQVA